MSRNTKLTAWRTVILEKVAGLQLVKKFPPFHESGKFVTDFTTAATCSYPEPDPDQSSERRPIFFLYVPF